MSTPSPSPRAPGQMSPGDASASLMNAVSLRMSEDELDRLVRGALKDLERLGRKVLRMHPWSSRHTAGGWPDWAIVGSGGFMLRELKRENQKPRPDQQEWLDMLTAAGIDADVWKPSDWYSGRVTRELAALAGMGGAT